MGWFTSMSICLGVNVVHSNRCSPHSKIALGKRQAGPRTINAEQVRLTSSRREHPIVSKKHSRKGRLRTFSRKIFKLRRIAGYMVDNQICHQVILHGQAANILPVTDSRIHLSVITGVKARIGAIDGIEKGQQVHAAENASEGTVEQASECVDVLREPIRVRYELDLVFHNDPPLLALLRVASLIQQARYSVFGPWSFA